MSVGEFVVYFILSTALLLMFLYLFVRLYFIKNAGDYDVNEGNKKNNVVYFNDSIQRRRKFDRDI